MGEEFDEEILKEFPPYEVENLTKEDILGDTVINYLISLEDSAEKILAIERVREKAKELKIVRPFNALYKQRAKEDTISKKAYENSIGRKIIFPELEGIEYITTRYEINENGAIYEIIPDVGKILVCYHPILPIEKYTNLEDGTEKIKIAFYKKEKWHNIIVDKSVISSNQKIVNLSDYGIYISKQKHYSAIRNLCTGDDDYMPIWYYHVNYNGEEVLMFNSSQFNVFPNPEYYAQNYYTSGEWTNIFKRVIAQAINTDKILEKQKVENDVESIMRKLRRN